MRDRIVRIPVFGRGKSLMDKFFGTDPLFRRGARQRQKRTRMTTIGERSSIDHLIMTPKERKLCSFLIVEDDRDIRDQLKKALRALGFESIYLAGDHLAAIKVLESRNFTHTIFCTKETNMPAHEYLTKVFTYDPGVIAVACSANPHVDDVFELLRIGALGFLMKPFTAETVEITVLMATRGQPLSDAILNARDRNEAFSAIIAANLDKVATARRQRRRLGDMLIDNTQQSAIDLRACTELARTFAKGGEDSLLERLVDFLIELSKGRASRLGRLRQKLSQRRCACQKQEETEGMDSSPRGLDDIGQ